MANTQVFRTYTLAVRARAGLQILNHAIYHVAGEYRDEAELLTKLDAGALMWEAREKILKAAAGRRMPHLRRRYTAHLAYNGCQIFSARAGVTSVLRQSNPVPRATRLLRRLP